MGACLHFPNYQPFSYTGIIVKIRDANAKSLLIVEPCLSSYTMQFRFVYWTADIHRRAALKLLECRDIAIRYTNLNGIIYKWQIFIK